MATLFLLWDGDLKSSGKYQTNPETRVHHRHRPTIIKMKADESIITIGRHDSPEDLTFRLESAFVQCLVSPLHATIQRLDDDVFELEDHSTNGTYVNYERVNGRKILSEGDVVCFGHFDAAFIQPSERVPRYPYDLKYKVAIAPEDDVIFSNPEQD